MRTLICFVYTLLDLNLRRLLKDCSSFIQEIFNVSRQSWFLYRIRELHRDFSTQNSAFLLESDFLGPKCFFH